jgi:hypothetical protein
MFTLVYSTFLPAKNDGKFTDVPVEKGFQSHTNSDNIFTLEFKPHDIDIYDNVLQLDFCNFICRNFYDVGTVHCV